MKVESMCINSVMPCVKKTIMPSGDSKIMVFLIWKDVRDMRGKIEHKVVARVGSDIKLCVIINMLRVK